MAYNLDRKGLEYVRSRMPRIGLGTFQINGNDIFEVLDVGLKVGYRFIDTAQIYQNERHIGDALVELLPKYGLRSMLEVLPFLIIGYFNFREDVFITTKLSPANQGFSNCSNSLAESLRLLRTDYVDLALIHWPGTSRLKRENPKNAKMRAESWKTMERMHTEGKLRAIGVSNFNVSHLEEMIGGGCAKVMPAVNQCECHPHWVQPELISFCAQHDIHFQAYSSFGSESNRDDLFRDAKVRKMAAKYKCSVPNFLLAWALSQGMSALPRSRSRDHIRENFGASKILVSAEDIEVVKSEDGRKYCWDPEGVQ